RGSRKRYTTSRDVRLSPAATTTLAHPERPLQPGVPQWEGGCLGRLSRPHSRRPETTQRLGYLVSDASSASSVGLTRHPAPLTPSARAAAATASATAGATRSSNGLGTIRSGRNASPTTPAMASAAATFIPSVIRVARAASAPLNTPGKASTLLIWLG